MRAQPIDLEAVFAVEWFGGNRDAWRVAVMVARLTNTIDDLIDKDEPVSDAEICDAFLTCLVTLPMNPFYASIQRSVAPMWVPVFSAYEAATKFERARDAHGLESGHTLRYMPGMIVSYIITVCVGPEKSREYVPHMWKMVVGEKYTDYIAEHLE